MHWTLVGWWIAFVPYPLTSNNAVHNEIWHRMQAMVYDSIIHENLNICNKPLFLDWQDEKCASVNTVKKGKERNNPIEVLSQCDWSRLSI